MGKLDQHNMWICDSENPQETRDMDGIVQKLLYGEVWCANKSLVHFFIEQSIPASVYLDLFTEYDVPQLDDRQIHVVLRQNGAPRDWGLEV